MRVEAGGGGGECVDWGVGVVRLPVRGPPLLDGVEEVLVRRPEVRGGARHRVVAVARRRGPRLEVARALELLPDQARADDAAVTLDQRPVRPRGERDLRDAGDHERIDDPGQHGEREEQDERGDELPAHQTIPSPETTTSISLIPTKGTTRPPRP